MRGKRNQLSWDKTEKWMHDKLEGKFIEFHDTTRKDISDYKKKTSPSGKTVLTRRGAR